MVGWKTITQPRVGNKYLPIGSYTGKDFTWNLQVPHPISTVIPSGIKNIAENRYLYSEDQLLTEYPRETSTVNN